jgi:acyl-CoA reductase-like NAD-dependent aldehyde dehydrogenase
MILREPYGVIGVIAPWNYPLLLSINPVITALFTGNAAVLKPSEYSPYSGLLVEELCRDAGLPEGLVQVIIGGGPTGEALVRSGVDKVFFTGGSETGKSVMAAAADSLTPVALELGGKDAAIVLEDADLERTAQGIVWGAFQNAGQTCLSVERVFVVEGIYDAFLRQVLARVRDLRAGSTTGVDVGPITTPEQLLKLERQLEDAVERGGAVLVGGTRTDPASNVFLPTVVTGVESPAPLLQEESFGPVLPIMPVKDAEEALSRANETPFGLSASVWTGNRRRGEAMASRIRAGGVCVNDVMTHYAVPGLPFGGVGESGFGRSKGLEGLAEMTRTRSVLVDRWGMAREPWWYPYTKEMETLMRAGLAARLKGGFRGLLAGAAILIRKRRG